uniref:Uncharacterized protein n=1 Tax=Vitis vinifera TaxID=29760 RepID=A5C2D0_VITVI|nr:hypothetical protein VITISV_005440 [Vitis vinifera]
MGDYLNRNWDGVLLMDVSYILLGLGYMTLMLPIMEKIGERTIGATELSNSINKSLVELGGPAEAGLGIGGENQASIAGQIGAVERALEVGVGDASVERKGMNCRVHFAEKMRDQEVKSRRFSGLGAPKSVEERRNGCFKWMVWVLICGK